MSAAVDFDDAVRRLHARGYVEVRRSRLHAVYVRPGSDEPVVLPLFERIAPGVYALVAAVTDDAPLRADADVDAAFARLDALFARNPHPDPVAAVRAERDAR